MHFTNSKAGREFLAERGITFSPGCDFIKYKDKKESFANFDSRIAAKAPKMDNNFTQGVNAEGEIIRIPTPFLIDVIDEYLKEIGFTE